MTTRCILASVLCAGFLTMAALPARAGLVSLTAGGTITSNSSGDPTIALGTPWTFDITYDTAAPDMDFLTTGSPDATYGLFTNTGSPPALTHFHYKAGSYEVTIGNGSDFAAGSAMTITFTSVNAIDINIFSPALFPHLAGGAVSFHADFNAFSKAPIFTSDGLPTNIAITAASFDQSTVTLLPPSSAITGDVTSFAITAAPEPWTAGTGMVGLLVLLARKQHRKR